MNARATASVGFLVGAGLLVGGLISACSTDNNTIAAGPTTAGMSSVGGNSVVPSGGNAGAATGGSTAGGATAGGTGGSGGASACGPNSLKHADGLCYCQPSTLTQCADGCGDLMTDPDRCGDCMTKCKATQACAAGKCGAEPTTVLPAAAGCGAMRLAVAGGKLYFSDPTKGTISSVATTGGAATVLVPNQMMPTAIALSATSIFWLASGAKSVMTASLAGAGPKAVATSATDAIGGFTLSPDGMTVYFAAGVKVNKTPAAGGGAVTEIGHEDSGMPQALALSADEKYIGFPADVNGDVDVMKIVEGTPAVCASDDSTTAVNMNCGRLGRSQGDLILDTIFIVADVAYWANGLDMKSSSASTPTGFNDSFASSSSSTATKITAFTVGGGKVYFADDSGFVYQAPLMTNAPVTTMARGQTKPTSLVADDANLYWATEDCAIASMPLK